MTPPLLGGRRLGALIAAHLTSSNLVRRTRRAMLRADWLGRQQVLPACPTARWMAPTPGLGLQTPGTGSWTCIAGWTGSTFCETPSSVHTSSFSYSTMTTILFTSQHLPSTNFMPDMGLPFSIHARHGSHACLATAHLMAPTMPTLAWSYTYSLAVMNRHRTWRLGWRTAFLALDVGRLSDIATAPGITAVRAPRFVILRAGLRPARTLPTTFRLRAVAPHRYCCCALARTCLAFAGTAGSAGAAAPSLLPPAAGSATFSHQRALDLTGHTSPPHTNAHALAFSARLFCDYGLALLSHVDLVGTPLRRGCGYRFVARADISPTPPPLPTTPCAGHGLDGWTFVVNYTRWLRLRRLRTHCLDVLPGRQRNLGVRLVPFCLQPPATIPCHLAFHSTFTGPHALDGHYRLVSTFFFL